MTGDELLAKLKIDTDMSIYKLIEYHNNSIMTASNPSEKANIILTKFGIDPITDPRTARLMAVSLIKELYVQRDKFKIEKAVKVAHQHVANAHRFLGIPVPLEPSKSVKVSKDDDSYKMKKALEIYRKHGKKSVRECTEQIAKALKISYNSAYYYHRKISKA